MARLEKEARNASDQAQQRQSRDQLLGATLSGDDNQCKYIECTNFKGVKVDGPKGWKRTASWKVRGPSSLDPLGRPLSQKVQFISFGPFSLTLKGRPHLEPF